MDEDWSRHDRNRPGYLNNSQLTTTTKGISQRYNLDSYSDYKPNHYRNRDEELQKALKKMTKKLRFVSNNIKDTLINSVRPTASPVNQETDPDMAKHPSLKWNYKQSPRLQWCTEPVHPGHYSHRIAVDLSQRSHALNTYAAAQRYFPITLGSRLEEEGIKDYPDFSDTSLYKERIAETEAKLDELLGRLETKPQEYKGCMDLILVTPYQVELANLRSERLRIEEDRLLELKRLEELERIRGPKPKWYELKDTEFHYEAHKNNELLHSREYWQNMLEYREDLDRSREISRKTGYSQVHAY